MLDTTIIPRHADLVFYPDLSDREWKEMRSAGIGGTDLAVILGVSPWTTPLQLAQSKRGQGDEKIDNWNMARGRGMEPLILDWWTEAVGAHLYRPIPFMRDLERPWMVGSLDGIVVLPDETLAVVDAKSVNDSEWDDIPIQYVCQMQWYMHLTGIPRAYLIVSHYGKEPVPYLVEYDRETMEAASVKVAEWWQRHVVQGVDPDPTTDDERIAVYTERLRGKTLAVQATEEQMALAALIDQVADEERAAKARAAELKAKMLEAMVCMGASKIEWPTGSASISSRKGSIGWKDYALSKGGSEDDADAAGFRGAPSRFVTIRRKKEK